MDLLPKVGAPSNRQAWLSLLVLGLAGFLANGWAPEVFPGIRLYCGGVFYLVASICFGPLGGFLAALVACAGLHPLSSGLEGGLVFLVEGAAIGWLAFRRVTPVVACIGFWSVVGVPLGLLGLQAAMVAEAGGGWVTVLSRPLNGLVNVMLAEFLLVLPPVRRMLGLRRDPVRSLRDQLLQEFAVLTTVPLVVLSLAFARLSARSNETTASFRLGQVAISMRMQVEGHLLAHRKAVESMAVGIGEGGRFDQASAQRWLDLWHAMNPGFLTMLAADSSGRLVAASPATRPDGTRLLDAGTVVSDREYFRVPMASGTSFLSEAIQGRGFGTDPIVALSAPVRFSPGPAVAVVEGSLNLSIFRQFAEQVSETDAVVILVVDHADRVVYSNDRTHYPALRSLAGHELLGGLGNDRSSGVSRRFLRRGLAGRGGDPAGVWLVAQASTEPLGAQHRPWRVLLIQDMARVQAEAHRFYLWITLVALVAVALATQLARWTSSRMTRPVEALLRRTRSLVLGEPVSSETGGKGVQEGGGIREFSDLVADFDAMARRLTESYSALRTTLADRERLNEELRSVLQGLEQKVRERTWELAEAKTKAEKANRSKSDFLANMSHELRTPIHGVLGFSDLLLASKLSREQQEHTEVLRSCAESLLQLVNDILDLSKIEAGKLAFEELDFALDEVLESVLNLFRTPALQKSIQLECHAMAGVPRILRGDPLRLRQVLTNLVGNAVKFTSRGSVTLTLALLRAADSQSPHVIRFEVRDTGQGMPPEVLARLFQPFEQGDASTTRKHGGSGLGLVISRHLVRMMGGDITAESRPGSGSEFSFVATFLPPKSGAVASLPVEDRAARVLSLHSQGRKAASTSPAVARARLLVVEDNPVNQLLASRLLEGLGYTVLVAGDGVQALEILNRGERVDLVLMDCQMPAMDGYEATQRIRAAEAERNGIYGVPRLPVVAMTANAIVGERDKCFQAGMDDYLAKPVGVDGLEQVIRRWLGPSVRPTSGAAVGAGSGRGNPSEPVNPPVPGAASKIDRTALAGLREAEATSKGLVGTAFRIFIQDTESTLEQLRGAFAVGNLKQVGLYAHKIKGGAAFLGVTTVAGPGSAMEQAAREGQAEVAREQLGLLEAGFSEVLPELRQLAQES